MNDRDDLFLYFAVCGHDGSNPISLQSLDGTVSLNDSSSVFDRSYVGQILAHYPSKRSILNFPEEILALCLPRGLQFCEGQPKPEPTFHNFLCIKADGTRIPGCTLMFWEPVEDPVEIRSMLQKTLPQAASLALSDTGATRVLSTTSSTLPRRTRTHHGGVTELRDSENNIEQQQMIYVTKCICLVCQLPVIDLCEKLLNALYKAIVRGTEEGFGASQISPESYIHWLLWAIPVPLPGKVLRVCHEDPSFGVDMIFQRPDEELELPLFDFNLHEALQTLGVETFLRLFGAVLLEQRVLLLSKSVQRLILVAESLAALLAPFRWQNVYVPILPYAQVMFLEAPLPYIMGLQCQKIVPEDLGLSCSICIADLDRGVLELPDELPLLPERGNLAQEIWLALENFENQKHVMMQDDSGISSGHPIGGLKRSSRSFDEESLASLLAGSEAFTKISAIAKGCGVTVDSLEHGLKSKCSLSNRAYFSYHLLNNRLRETFFAWFCRLFSGYHQYLLPNSTEKFDKASFLCDQPQPNLPFLAAFLETQMMQSFIDSSILRNEYPDSNIKLFDLRLKQINGPALEMSLQSLAHEFWSSTNDQISLRENMFDFTVSSPKRLPVSNPTVSSPGANRSGIFPILNMKLLEVRAYESPTHRLRSRLAKRQTVDADRRLAAASVKNNMELPSCASQIAETNWKFVEQLLREAKQRTKRLLVAKLGFEALQLGHNDPAVQGLEENTLVASLCDLLERIWAHGLNARKQGRSALWTHVMHTVNQQRRMESLNRQIASGSGNEQSAGGAKDSLKDAYSSGDEGGGSSTLERIKKWQSPLPYRRRRPSGSMPGSPENSTGETESNNQIQNDITHDVRNVLRMTDIRTDLGYARAFVRLVLERKLLHRHLSVMLRDTNYLRKYYKRFAFVRCEEEKEQLLCHLLSLNAVDFRCFTNTFTKTKIRYNVRIVTGSRIRSFTTANLWIQIAGSLGQTSIMQLPKNAHNFCFEVRNLGGLSSLRIGHDNSGYSPRFFLDTVVVRNDVTGQIVKFRCGRWLGKAADDESLEQFLVAENVTMVEEPLNKALAGTLTPVRSRSPSSASSRKLSVTAKNQIDNVQQRLGEAVNNIVKYFHSTEKQHDLSYLLCNSHDGLIVCLDEALKIGLRPSRFFQKLHPWDHLEQSAKWFKNQLLLGGDPMNPEEKRVLEYFCNLISTINNEYPHFGKDGRLQQFLLSAIKQRILSALLQLLAWCPLTTTHYEESSFLRAPHYLTFLSKLLTSLNDYDFKFENTGKQKWSTESFK